MSRMHLIEGPVGAGKSTFGSAIAEERQAVRLTLDAWFATLFRPDRPQEDVMPWYIERKQRCLRQILAVADDVLAKGSDVVLELGLIQRQDRARFYEAVEGRGHELTVYVLDAPRALRWTRVARRNAERGATFSMEVPEPFFHLASDLWEAPDTAECAGRDIRFVDTSAPSMTGAGV